MNLNLTAVFRLKLSRIWEFGQSKRASMHNALRSDLLPLFLKS